MSSYPSITNYNQLLADGTLGSQNVDFFNGYGRLVSNSVALDTLSFLDQDYYQHFKTYGSVANYYERNRRLNGAYGTVYDAEVNWLNPLNHTGLYQENKCYYLQDLVHDGRYANLFIQGLTYFTLDRPRVYYQYYNSSFFTDPNSYYRVDVLGNSYPYSHGGKKTDIIIQQFSNYKVSDKLYLTFAEAFGHPYHSEYQIIIPITLPLFNDKLYNPTTVQPPVDDPVNDPVVNPVDPPVVPPVDTPQGPILSPYRNFGGDTTDTGPTESNVMGYNPTIGDDQREVEYYFPSIPGWRNWFIWY